MYYYTLNQGQLFAISVAIGLLCGVVYEVFRLIRTLFFHNNRVIAIVLDVVFFLVVVAVIALMILFLTDGRFRLFHMIGAVLGFYIYLFGVGKIFRIFYSFCRKIFDKIQSRHNNSN
ncbi:MAG: spore cortex biosynthesis protein YabQ [Christensenellales bacterium]|jgi:peptidoglycan biosynthesis protein MviN/MurJ (putative lipid II flippase)